MQLKTFYFNFIICIAFPLTLNEIQCLFIGLNSNPFGFHYSYVYILELYAAIIIRKLILKYVFAYIINYVVITQ